ncbi:hypothetical protein AVEN_204767-1 [Araneus ventricosus]|uniref:Secreted protein n=1 Tax=Araneus ventricosus TaxID=182803 RepID=A0A4Y2FYZ1_ARAVE|nr:hypothetical protein AVEN_204767-1 [Araneus ventricosus]
MFLLTFIPQLVLMFSISSGGITSMSMRSRWKRRQVFASPGRARYWACDCVGQVSDDWAHLLLEESVQEPVMTISYLQIAEMTMLSGLDDRRSANLSVY